MRRSGSAGAPLSFCGVQCIPNSEYILVAKRHTGGHGFPEVAKFEPVGRTTRSQQQEKARCRSLRYSSTATDPKISDARFRIVSIAQWSRHTAFLQVANSTSLRR